MKLTFLLENKLYDRKESSPTKYYCIRSNSFLKNFLRSPLTYSMNLTSKHQDNIKSQKKE